MRTPSRLALALALTVAPACRVDGDYTGLPDAAFGIDAPLDAPLSPAMLMVTPGDDLAIGDVVVGQPSGRTTFTVSNSGDETSGAIDLAYEDDTLGFAIVDDACTGHTLSATQTCTFAVQLTPAAAGAAATVLHVVADPGGDVARQVSGTGLEPGVVDIVETGHDFAALSIDAAATTFTVTVRNRGQVPIGTPMPSTSGSAAYTIDSTTCTAPLGQADTCTVTIAFDPSTVGSKAGSMTVTSSAGGGASDGGQDVVTLAGVGIAAVSVTRTGTGGGLVSSTQPGINCGTACDADFASSPVTLTAQPTLGSMFVGWSADCTGTGTCALDLTGSKSVVARFDLISYPLTVTQTGTGAGSIATAVVPVGTVGTACGAGCLAYPYQTMVTLTPMAAAGSTFTGWSGDCSGTGACSVTMDGAHNVTATFAINTYSLSVTSAGTGTGVVASNIAGANGGIDCGTACSDIYAHAQMVVLSATPATGSLAPVWTGCTSVTGGNCNVTMTGARSVTATFNLGSYALTVSRMGTGSVASVDGNISCPGTCGHSYVYDTAVTLNATPGTGWHFDHWAGGPCNLSTSTACMITIPATSTSTQAVFVIDTELLTVALAGSGTGTVTASPSGITCPGTCSTTYNYGTSVTLTAVPTGGALVSWDGCDSAIGNSCVVAMTAARAVTTTFNSGPQTLTVTRTGNGTGTVTSSPAGISCGATCAASFAFNTMVTLTATPVFPATFAGWSGACTGTSTCMVTMNQARDVTATFSAGDQLLTFTQSGTGGGSLSLSPSNPPTSCPTATTCYYPYNTTVVITESPNASSVFATWSGDCTGSGTACSVSMTQARTVDAEFTLVMRRLTVALSGSGNVTPSPVGTVCGVRCWDYAHGTLVTLTATPDTGSTFTGWSLGSCSGTGTCQVVMTADTPVTATFVPNYTLTVTVNGTGAGSVTGSPGGIACTASGGTCSAEYPGITPATVVTLTATVGADSVFTGWGGACSGTMTTCNVTMNAAKSVTATFLRYYDLTVATTGPGSVSQAVSGGSEGPTCGANCRQYTSGATVSLTATPTSGSDYFVGWTGACMNQGATCNLPMSADASTAATFGTKVRLTVTKVGAATNTVTAIDGSINCGAACTSEYVPGTMVTLNATSSPGSLFAGWNGGGCAGTGACTVTMNMMETVSATFNYNLSYASSNTDYGTVIAGSGGIPCTPEIGFLACMSYPPSTVVTMTADPKPGHAFTGWSGACTGNGACMVTMTAPRTVTGTFAPQNYLLMVSRTSNGAGDGTVISSMPGGITCGQGGNACAISLPYNSQITLTATPDGTNGRFVQWNTGSWCAGSTQPTCVVTIGTTGNSAQAAFDWFVTVQILKNGAPSGVMVASLASTNPPGSPAPGISNCAINTAPATPPPNPAPPCAAGFPRGTVVSFTYAEASGAWTSCRSGARRVKVLGGAGLCVPPIGVVAAPALSTGCNAPALSTPGLITQRVDLSCEP